MKIIQIGNINPSKTRNNPNQGRVYDIRGISPTITNMSGGGRQPYIVTEANNERQDNSSNHDQK